MFHVKHSWEAPVLESMTIRNSQVLYFPAGHPYAHSFWNPSPI